MNDVVTKRDLIDQNIDKVFPHGISEAENPPQVSTGTVTLRPGFGGNAIDIESAKLMSMGGPLIPEFMRGNAGQCWMVIQMAKRWSRYDERTNSWISFDPGAIASCMYVVESGGRTTFGYTSQFIGALVDAFTSAKLRFYFDGEGQDLMCKCVGKLGDDPEPFEYITPPLKLITPKRSPLWESDPRRQLSYYARRAWARLFTPGVLLGVYDVDELEGRIVHRVRDLTPVATEGLHERLARAAAENQGEREGFSAGAVDDLPGERGAEPAGSAEVEGVPTPAPKKNRRTSGLRTVKVSAPKAKEAPKGSKKEAARQPEPVAPLPTSAKAYRAYVVAWLPDYETEEAVEARWRSEMKLRNYCGVVEEERAAIRLLVDARIQQLRA